VCNFILVVVAIYTTREKARDADQYEDKAENLSSKWRDENDFDEIGDGVGRDDVLLEPQNRHELPWHIFVELKPRNW
jgi:hypothetical protein